MTYHHGNQKLSIYTRQKCMAKYRQIDWQISFEDWSKIWDQSGKWEQRGRGKGKYCMSRIGDTGPYSADNVFIQECVKNSGDKFRGSKQSQETKSRRSKALTGVKHSLQRRLANSLGQLKYRAKQKSIVTL
jgi:hypothetical protein